MNAKEVINSILEQQGRSKRSLAKQLAVPPQTVQNRLRDGKDMRIEVFIEMLDALGYEVKVVPQEDKRPDFSLSSKETKGAA